MSYILDALRRAEAERERGAVPSLQSQQHTVIEEDDTTPRSRRLMWVIVGLGGALLALLAWTLFGGSTAPPRPVVEGSVAPAVVAPPAARCRAGRRAECRVACDRRHCARAGARACRNANGRARCAAGRGNASRAGAACRRPPAGGRGRRGTARGAARPERVGRNARRRRRAASAAPRIYAQGELPEDVRRDLPRIAINGSSYSGDAASRMVMINGQIFHEGDSLGTGLELEKINRRSAVLVFRGWRYEVAF